MNVQRRRTGFTLVEVMVAGSVLCLLTLAFLEGVILATRIARENSERLAAEAFAYDLTWMRFNEDYESLEAGTTTSPITTDYSTALRNFVPVLNHWPDCTARTRVWKNGYGKTIETTVNWGPNNSRSVSHRVNRGSLTRVQVFK